MSFPVKEIWDGGIGDHGSLIQRSQPNYNSPLKKLPNTFYPRVEDEDEKNIRQEEAFKLIIASLEKQKNKEAVAVVEVVPEVFAALGVKTLAEALERIREFQWEIDRLNTMLADAYNDALNGIER